MSLGELFDEPANTREELMGATYRALCEHGYAALTIQRISDQFPKSRSLLYHHYDSKDELLVDFLSFVLDHLESTTPQDDDEPLEALQRLLGYLIPAEPSAEQRQFRRAIIELRAQAATDPEYRAQFSRSTDYFEDRFAAIIERGCQAGVFHPVDADRVATLIVTTVDGAMLREATTTPDDLQPAIDRLRAELTDYIERRLLAVDDKVIE